MSWLQRQFGIGRVKTALNDDIMSAAFGITNSASNPITTSRTAMEKSVWVYRAVNTVASRIGSLPWSIYQGEKAVVSASRTLKRPNPYQTFVEVLEQVVSWQLIKGFGALYAEPMNLRSLDADMIRNEKGTLQVLEGGNWKQIDPKLLVLFPNLSLSGQMGLSELSTVMDAANMDENAKQVWNNQMNSGGILSGLLSTDVKLPDAELQAMRSRWEERYGGVQKAGTMGFLGAGFKFTPMGISAADMKMLEVSKVTRNEIGAAFGVPGIFLNDTESVDYSNAQTQEKILYSNTVCPKADRIADRISVFLLPLLGLKGYEFRFDYSGIEALQEDKYQRAQIDEIQLRSGALTINEIRERDGLKKVKWGDAWWTSAMSVPVTTSDLPEPAPALPPEPVPVPVDEGKAITKGISTETRRIIAKSFLSTVKPQERKFASNTMKVFNAQAKLVASWVEEHEKAAPVKKLRDVLADDDFVESWHSLFVAFGKSALEDVAARYDMIVPDGSEILKWIRAQESKHSKLVNDTTADEISKILADARANGESIADMVKATKQYFDGISYRAERVARTNVIAVNNASAQDVYVENGVQKHEWLSTADERTRDDHAEADGQVVAIGEPFSIGGESLMYPGDPSGSADETINCRCTILPVI
jgi:HK97 family phage portal protein